MKKVSAITWASSGKKLAVAAADRVNIFIYISPSICLMKMDRRKINSQLSLLIKDRNLISLEHLNSLLIQVKLLLLKVITLFSSIKSVQIGGRKKLFVINSQYQLLLPV